MIMNIIKIPRRRFFVAGLADRFCGQRAFLWVLLLVGGQLHATSNLVSSSPASSKERIGKVSKQNLSLPFSN